MCRASCVPYFFFLGCLTVTVFVSVFAVPPVGVYVIFRATFSCLSFFSAVLAFEDRLTVMVWAPDLVALTVLVESLIVEPFLGLVDDATLIAPAPGSCRESRTEVPLTRAEEIVNALLIAAGGGVIGVTGTAGMGVGVAS